VQLKGQAADNCSQAVELIRSENPDLVFLDVHLKGDENGFDVLRQVGSTRSRVIFVTGYSEYAVRAFEFHAAHYLVKPFKPEQLVEAVRHAAELTEQETLSQWYREITLQYDDPKDPSFSLPHQRERLQVRLSNILYIQGGISETEKGGPYCTYHLEGLGRVNTVGESRNLKKVMDRFRGFQFMLRVHNSFIVNMTKVQGYNAREHKLKLCNGAYVPVSDGSLGEVKRWLDRLN
jgi:two-component system LytT family response regulator